MSNYIYVFQGSGARLCTAVFSSMDKAEAWIKKYGLSGLLTKYPLNEGVYDWAIENHYFTPKNEQQKTPVFIQKFSSASLEHFHYESGERE